MEQSQILQPCPLFLVMLLFMVNFRSKNIFSSRQTSRMDKKHSFGKKLNFIEKKKYFFGKIFMIFEFFTNGEAWLQNLRLVYDFSIFLGLFDTYIGPGSAFILKWEIQRLKLLGCLYYIDTVPTPLAVALDQWPPPQRNHV